MLVSWIYFNFLPPFFFFPTSFLWVFWVWVIILELKIFLVTSFKKQTGNKTWFLFLHCVLNNFWPKKQCRNKKTPKKSFDIWKKKTDWYLKKQQNKENFFSKHFTDQKITSVILTAVFGDSGAELSFWIGKGRSCLFWEEIRGGKIASLKYHIHYLKTLNLRE